MLSLDFAHPLASFSTMSTAPTLDLFSGTLVRLCPDSLTMSTCQKVYYNLVVQEKPRVGQFKSFFPSGGIHRKDRLDKE